MSTLESVFYPTHNYALVLLAIIAMYVYGRWLKLPLFASCLAGLAIHGMIVGIFANVSANLIAPYARLVCVIGLLGLTHVILSAWRLGRFRDPEFKRHAIIVTVLGVVFISLLAANSIERTYFVELDGKKVMYGNDHIPYFTWSSVEMLNADYASRLRVGDAYPYTWSIYHFMNSGTQAIAQQLIQHRGLFSYLQTRHFIAILTALSFVEYLLFRRRLDATSVCQATIVLLAVFSIFSGSFRWTAQTNAFSLFGTFFAVSMLLERRYLASIFFFAVLSASAFRLVPAALAAVTVILVMQRASVFSDELEEKLFGRFRVRDAFFVTGLAWGWYVFATVWSRDVRLGTFSRIADVAGLPVESTAIYLCVLGVAGISIAGILYSLPRISDWGKTCFERGGGKLLFLAVGAAVVCAIWFARNNEINRPGITSTSIGYQLLGLNLEILGKANACEKFENYLVNASQLKQNRILGNLGATVLPTTGLWILGCLSHLCYTPKRQWWLLAFLVVTITVFTCALISTNWFLILISAFYFAACAAVLLAFEEESQQQFEASFAVLMTFVAVPIILLFVMPGPLGTAAFSIVEIVLFSLLANHVFRVRNRGLVAYGVLTLLVVSIVGLSFSARFRHPGGTYINLAQYEQRLLSGTLEKNVEVSDYADVVEMDHIYAIGNQHIPFNEDGYDFLTYRHRFVSNFFKSTR